MSIAIRPDGSLWRDPPAAAAKAAGCAVFVDDACPAWKAKEAGVLRMSDLPQGILDAPGYQRRLAAAAIDGVEYTTVEIDHAAEPPPPPVEMVTVPVALIEELDEVNGAKLREAAGLLVVQKVRD